MTKVLVIGMNGRGLMPTTPRKARVLLKEQRAKVIRKTPFTIRLLYKTGCACQEVTLGIDTGSQHIGVSVTSGNKVLEKSEWKLRSTMEKKSLLEARKILRRSRRYRKTRYRHPKFKAHTKRVYSEKPVTHNGHLTHWKKVLAKYQSDRPKGWLPPSVQSKVNIHIMVIKRYLEALPDSAKMRIELGRFDMAKIQNPDIKGTDYQYGPQYGYENIKAYVFARDGYKCQCCHKKGGSQRKDGTIVKLIAHHIDYRSKASTDNPKRIATVCDRCHSAENHKPGGELYDWMIKGRKFSRGMRDMTMENIVSARLAESFPDASFTYGNFTKANRETIGLKKSHANDAVAIAMYDQITKEGLTSVIDAKTTTFYKQVRRKKRSLHEANPRKGRKEPNRTAKRNRKNVKSVGRFSLYDKVQYNGRTGWITGFAGQTAYIQDIDGNYITYEGKNYKNISLSKLVLLSKGKNWILDIKQE